MENSLLIGLSRQTALQRELDVVANNIANVNTTGFKADGAVFAEFLQSRASTELFAAPDRRMSMVQDRMSWHDMSQGTVQQTGGPLDVAIDGEGMLVVQTARGERYTRNGALQINNLGEVVTLAGDKVLGDNGPIVLQLTDRDIAITKNGTIKVREGQSLNSDSTRGKLRLVTFADPQQLRNPMEPERNKCGREGGKLPGTPGIGSARHRRPACGTGDGTRSGAEVAERRN